MKENESAYEQLTPQYRLFVDCYIDPTRGNFNQTQSAIMAGYSKNSARLQGHRLMRKDNVLEAIREKQAASTMRAEEALQRLTVIARSDLSPFYSKVMIEGPDGEERPFLALDLESDEAKENFHLIRAIIPTRDGKKIILHDQQAALLDILRIHGKFVQRMDITSADERIETIQLVEIRRDDEQERQD